MSDIKSNRVRAEQFLSGTRTLARISDFLVGPLAAEFAAIYTKGQIDGAHLALEAGAIEADKHTGSDGRCQRGGGCFHVDCLMARRIAYAIRTLSPEIIINLEERRRK